MRPRFLVLACLLLCSTAFAQRKYVGWSTGYHTTWGGQNIADMYFKAYTHICWFDGGINGPSSSEGLDFTSTCHKNNTKAIVCIGGQGAGGDFTRATTNANRGAYISRLVAMMQAQGFDGIDMDWEDTINAAQYTALHTELRAALDKITPRPLLTVATAQYLSDYTAPLYQVFDQMNVMSYWVLVGGVASQMNSFTNKGVPKAKLGVGWGYDTDGEVDVDNPDDIAAKCLYSINNGFGGVMVWEIARACAKCQDTNAYYVNKIITPVRPMIAMAQAGQQASFTIINNGAAAGHEIRFLVPSAQSISFQVFDMKGGLVRNLTHQEYGPGTYTIPLAANNAGHGLIRSGIYVVKMATPKASNAAAVVVK
jgi:chitinase